MFATSLCLVAVLIGIVLIIAIITNKRTDNELITIVAAIIALGIFGYLFQYLNIILLDLLEQFQIYYLSK